MNIGHVDADIGGNVPQPGFLIGVGGEAKYRGFQDALTGGVFRDGPDHSVGHNFSK